MRVHPGADHSRVPGPILVFTPLLTSSIPRGCPASAGRKGPWWKPVFPELNFFFGGRTQTRALSTIATATGQRQRPRGQSGSPAALHPPGTKASMPYFFWSERRSGCPWRGGRVGAGGGVLEEERKIPLKLMGVGSGDGTPGRRTEHGFGEPGLVLGLMGADTGLEAGAGTLVKKPLEGLPEPKGLSTCRQKDRQTGEVPWSPDGSLCGPALLRCPLPPSWGVHGTPTEKQPHQALAQTRGGLRGCAGWEQGQPVHRLGRTTPSTPTPASVQLSCKGASGRREDSQGNRSLESWPLPSGLSAAPSPGLHFKNMHLSLRSGHPAIMLPFLEGGSTDPQDLRVWGPGACPGVLGVGRTKVSSPKQCPRWSDRARVREKS